MISPIFHYLHPSEKLSLNSIRYPILYISLIKNVVTPDYTNPGYIIYQAGLRKKYRGGIRLKYS